MTGFRTVIFVLCCLFLSLNAAAAVQGGIRWQTLEPGLDLARVTVTFTPSSPAPSPPTSADDGGGTSPLTGPQEATTTILRIDPEKFTFSLYMASEQGPKTLGQIGTSENFVAAINAGMFQRDGVTNTGYLRSRSHTNNGHVAANFGAFFVARPEKDGLPQARLLDKHADDWETALRHYGLVMQNYRMTAPDGRVIWKQADRLHSVAALSQDTKGNILFLLCPSPVPAADYMAALLRLPLGIGVVMYLEGGSEAALLINAGGINAVEAGRHTSGLWSGSASLMLPNVLGVRRRAEPGSAPSVEAVP
ncbi:MAG: phosphodiester glycosidase family protein [Deltaproteobacteria bacterium]|nr:phosphodiester glycosidase family protein [Deltaproteobacteria bacterium]